MPKQKQKQKASSNEEDEEEYRDREDKWSGFHFTRLTCISILTLILMIVALILDNLSIWGKIRTCTKLECQHSQGSDCECGDWSNSDDSYEYYPTCEAHGQCGWRTGFTKWIKPFPSSTPECPSCTDGHYCTEESTSDSTEPLVDEWSNWRSEFNYRILCGDKDKEGCMAFNGGNVYIVFTVVAVIINLFTLCVIAPLYCRDDSIFPCEFCDEKTHIVLGVVYGVTAVCNFIPVVVWLGLADGGMCDNADPNAQTAFLEDTINWPGYSTGALMICLVANLVACGAVCCCWGDNRHYGEERDLAMVDRDREKEMYKQQETQQQQQGLNQQNYNQNQDQNQNQNQNQYNNNPNQGYGQQQNQGGQQPTYNQY